MSSGEGSSISTLSTLFSDLAARQFRHMTPYMSDMLKFVEGVEETKAHKYSPDIGKRQVNNVVPVPRFYGHQTRHRVS